MISIKLSDSARPLISKSLIIHQQQKSNSNLTIPLRDNHRKGSELRIKQDFSPKERIQQQFNQLKIKLNDALSRTTSPQPSIRSNQHQSTKEITLSALRRQQLQKESQYKLEVSFSNDSSLESSFDDEFNEEFQQAKESLAKITQQPSSFQKQSNNRLSLPFIIPSQRKQSDVEEEKINLQFLKSLEQNQENKDIDEYYDNSELNINFQSSELQQFIRYEQEVLELVNRTTKYADIQQQKQEMFDQLNRFEHFKEYQAKMKQEQQNQIVKHLANKHSSLNTNNYENIASAKKIDKLAFQFIDKGIKNLTLSDD